MDENVGLTGRLATMGAGGRAAVLVNDGERFLPTMDGEVAFEHVHRYLLVRSLCAGKVVADIACGEGYGSALLAKAARQVYGIDISAQTVDWARSQYAKPNLTFFQADALCLPLGTASCDMVVSFETIEHVADPDRLLAEFSRVLKKGGLLAVSTPDKEVYNRQRSEPNEYHLHEMYRDEFEVILRKHFRNVSMHGQQYFEGSIVLGGSNGRRRFSFRPTAPKLLFAEEIGDALPSAFAPTYLFALAGNGSLPDLPLSLLASAEHPQIYKERYVALNDELNERTEWLKAVQDELAQTQRRGGETENRLAEAERGLEEREAALNALRVDLAERESALEAIRKDLAQREEALNDLRTDLAAREEALEALRQDAVAREEVLEDLRQDSAAREEALNAERTHEARAHSESVEALREEISGLVSALSESKEQTLDLSRRMEALEPLAERCQSSEARCAEAMAERDRSREEAQTLLRDSDAAVTEQGRLGAELHDMRQENRALSREADVLRTLVQAFETKAQSLRGEAVEPEAVRRQAAPPSKPADHSVATAFDRNYYLARNPDVAHAGVEPLRHYLENGWKEKRVHSLLFDDEAYLTAYPDLREAGVPPLLHYCGTGWREGRDPSPLFDTAYYLATYPEVAESGLDPLAHFIHHGLSKSYRPTAELNPADFLGEADRQSSGFGLLARFLEKLREAGRDIGGIALPTSDTPTVSVIIPVHGNLALTRACLKSIERHLPQAGFEVIIVDDGSRDLTTLAAPFWHGVTLLRNPGNLGFVAACNRGAAEARGKYLLFLNNDTEVKEGWLDELLGTFALHPGAGLAGSKLVYPDGRLQEAGGIIWEDASGWNVGRGDDPAKPEYNHARDVDYVSGAALMIPKTLFWAVGGFDPRFAPGYFEDTDLAFAVRALGYRVLYQPLSVIVHHEGGTAGTDLAHGMKAFQEINRPKFIEKWRSVLGRHLPNGRTPHIARDRTKRRRMLMIDATTPTPDKDAGSLTQSYMIALFQKLGFQVTFIPEDNFTHIGKYTEDLQRRGVETIHHPYCTSIRQHLEARSGAYDLIMAYRAPRVARYIDDLRELAPQAKILVDTADVHHLRLMREAEISGSKAKMAEALATRDAEYSVMREADCTIILSVDEIEMLSKELPEAKLAHLPLILEAPGPQAGFDDLADICYVGGFGHNPNVDAVLYFHREIWPLIRARLPGVRFRVIGSHPPEEIRALAGRDVLVDGYVRDLGPTLGRCRLSVVPLRFGAGIKGKIGSSLSYGVPVVSTTVGAEGMALVDGRDILVADAPEAFADQVCRLYTDRKLWNKLSWAGLDFVRREYSLEVSEHRLVRILRTLGLHP